MSCFHWSCVSCWRFCPDLYLTLPQHLLPFTRMKTERMVSCCKTQAFTDTLNQNASWIHRRLLIALMFENKVTVYTVSSIWRVVLLTVVAVHINIALQWYTSTVKYLIWQCCDSKPARLKYTAAKVNTFGEMTFPENSKMQILFCADKLMWTLWSSAMERLSVDAINWTLWLEYLYKLWANLILLTG